MTKTDSSIASGPRTAILVLGVDCLGTSALSGILARMDYAGPRDQISVVDGGLKRLFESKPLSGLNEQLLKHGWHRWDNWQPPVDDWLATERVYELRSEAKRLLEMEFGSPEKIVFKGTLLCRLFPFWTKILEEQGVLPLALLVHGNPREVAASLAAHNGYETEKGLLLWLSYVLQAEADSRGYRRAFIEFDRLVEAPEVEIARFARLLEQPVLLPPETRAAIYDFCGESIQPRRSLIEVMELPPIVDAVYNIFQRWASEGEDVRDHAALDHVRRLIVVCSTAPEPERQTPAAAIAWLSRHWFPDPDNLALAEIAQYETSSPDDVRTTLKVLHDQAAGTAIDVANQRQEISSLRAGIDSRDRELGLLARLLAEADARQVGLEAQVTAARENNRKLKEALAATKCDLKLERDESAIRQVQLDEAKQEKTQRVAEISQLTEENAMLEARLAEVEDHRRALAESTIWRATAPLRKTLEMLRSKRD